MERYKLIQTYPGSPEKNSIVHHPHNQKAFNDMYFKLNNEKNINNQIFFLEQEIKDFPKNWKKIQ